MTPQLLRVDPMPTDCGGQAAVTLVVEKSADLHATLADLHATVVEVLGLTNPGSVVSTRAAIDAVRRRVPELSLQDEDLANMIADLAIARGLSVTFDSREG